VKYTLFQIGEEIRALAELLMETGGEITDPEAEAAIDEWLAETQVALERKADQVVWLIREFEGRADAREEAAKALMALAEVDRNGARRLRDRLKLFFEIHGLKRLETEHFKLAIAQNGGKVSLIVPAEWEQEPASAPEAFHRIKVELDRQEIEAALSGARKLCPGCGSATEPAEGFTIEFQPAARCLQCGWIGRESETAHYGERGRHLRIR
jgi:hypothetical protein